MTRKTNFLLLVISATLVASMSPRAVSAGPKKKVDTWHLDVVFVVGTQAWDEPALKPRVKAWIREQVKTAERVFDDSPALDIDYKIERKTSLGGKSLSNPTFDGNRDYRQWMDRYADNVATSKTEGHLTVLVVDSFCVKNKKRKAKKTGQSHKCPGGRAWFPHWVTPFGSKTGIALVYGVDEYVLAHEIGHFLGLRHTFERYTNPDPRLVCNRDYDKGKKGQCSSCKGTVSGKSCSGSSNVMDYCGANTQYLNDCQKRRAANQRRKYMTRKGETNYRKLTGR